MQTLAKPSGAETENRMVIICSKGSPALAHPLLLMATSAAEEGIKVELYFTLGGLNVLARRTTDQSSQLSSSNLPSLNLKAGTFPPSSRGRRSRTKVKLGGVNKASTERLIKAARAVGVEFYACGPSMETLGLTRDDLAVEIDGIVMSKTYLEMALVKPELYIIGLVQSEDKGVDSGALGLCEKPIKTRGAR